MYLFLDLCLGIYIFFTVNKSIKRLVCAEKIAFTSSKDLDILPSENLIGWGCKM